MAWLLAAAAVVVTANKLAAVRRHRPLRGIFFKRLWLTLSMRSLLVSGFQIGYHSWSFLTVRSDRLPQTLFCRFPVARSEEHTSELQSRPHLVCRLLLEKK